MRRYEAWIALVAFAAITLACREAPERHEPPTAVAPPQAVYSPFVVKVEGGAPYRNITFKQVGSMTQSVDRAALFETVAESLALQLLGTEVSVSAAYVPEVAEADFHRFCGAAHIYVDFWERSGEDPGWGFSLWSGCSAQDRFALEDVPAPKLDDVTRWVEPLTRRIADALADARRTGCFQRSC